VLVVEAFVALMRTAYTRLAVRTPSFFIKLFERWCIINLRITLWFQYTVKQKN